MVCRFLSEVESTDLFCMDSGISGLLCFLSPSVQVVEVSRFLDNGGGCSLLLTRVLSSRELIFFFLLFNEDRAVEKQTERLNY